MIFVKGNQKNESKTGGKLPVRISQWHISRINGRRLYDDRCGYLGVVHKLLIVVFVGHGIFAEFSFVLVILPLA